MTRLKFLGFALLFLGLLGVLVYVSPGVTARTNEQATAGLAGAQASVALRLESQRSDLQAALIRVVNSPSVLNPGPRLATGKPEAPTVDRHTAVRAAAVEGLTEAQKAGLAVGVVNESGALFAVGDAVAAAAPEGVDVSGLASAAQLGGAGTMGSINGTPTIFYATPLLVSDRNEVRTLGAVLLGLPLLPDPKAVSEALARELRLEAAGIASGGALLASGGPQKALAEKAFKALKANSSGALELSPVHPFGPIALPMFTDPLPLETAARHEIAGTPYEVIAVVSGRAGVEALATYQSYAIALFAAFALLSIVMMLLLGSDDDGVRMSVPPPLPVPPISRPTPQPSASTLALPEPHTPEEASPDDFDFPAAGGSAASSSTGQQPALGQISSDDERSDPFAKLGNASQTAPTSQQPSYVPAASSASAPQFTPPSGATAQTKTGAANPFSESDDADRTVAYSGRSNGLPPDPFAMAASQSYAGDDSESQDDSTRVAAVPKELMQAARGGGNTGDDQPVFRPVSSAALPKVQAAGLTEEERHFQEVFRDFISTREKCGEPADGLTFEKFRQKLLKNKDQLVAKYSCKTVRFQVYVKEGKAALKATPVKE